WKMLADLPRDEFIAFLLYARGPSGDELVAWFIETKIVSEREFARLMHMTLEESRELRRTALPLDNLSISTQLGVSVERVYKLRCRAGKRLERFLSELCGKNDSPR